MKYAHMKLSKRSTGRLEVTAKLRGGQTGRAGFKCVTALERAAERDRTGAAGGRAERINGIRFGNQFCILHFAFCKRRICMPAIKSESEKNARAAIR